jgi:hypothetical protein
MRRSLVIWAAVGTALTCLAQLPTSGKPSKTASVSPSLGNEEDGAQYDPRADYDQGVLAAEEEIEGERMTLWVLTTTNPPPDKDLRTGLPVTPIEVGPDEPWHRHCMEHRARGHNDTILRFLRLPTEQPSPASTNAPAEKQPRK